MKRPTKSLSRLLSLALGTTALTGFLAVTPASAENLIDALTAAYATNPTLQAQRAQLRATDELVPQALSGWRPNLQAQGAYGVTSTDTTLNNGASARDDLRPLSGSVTLSQNLFAGGRTVNATDQAEASVQSGRESLLSVEQTTLLNAVQAYMNVIRDQSVLELNRNNVEVLKRQLDATTDRFRVGELTRTDTAQSEARLSLARSNLIAAEAQLTASRAFYERIVGQLPGTLEKPNRLEGLPATEEEARALAAQNNPSLRAARYSEEASREAIKVAKGALLPSFDVQAQYQYGRDPSSTIRDVEESSLLGVLTIPLYQSGVEYSRVREAKEINNQSRLQIYAVQRQVDEAVRNAWEQLRASRASITSTSEQANASNIALEGVRQESEVGARTTLDVLDAEQEFLNARVALVSAERDLAVAEYGLLAAMGQLTARNLELPVEYYDPEANYGEVRNKWIGFGTASGE
ncbi:type I secretion outer membrane protein, TolC family [Parvibaculum lavamentivorans DS-1]|uniref:Type I secretion outer membrane protein, TolC family n=1 Tax=Parvibaculum lavamentivorans (strain DS-1 / DSM 13023 / NCIMB 13966) TaxID=402881 RepID=A7HXH8_PARL1|nr:TolC family outer membrane protein [Parvibaculum lavamentivorans]ABS64611.1 type I secretion outer membrane protein, TolC family [Parvibaculum lavamentivorans DS-1]